MVRQLSEPVRLKIGLKSHLQQSFTFNPQPFVSFGWYGNLSEPVRFKLGLKTELQQFTTQDADFIPHPDEILDGWFNWLSEPKRFLQGLKVSYQPDYTAPSRMLPTPTLTVTIDTTEINSDAALMAINVVKYNTPATASVSLTEIGGGSATSIIESS